MRVSEEHSRVCDGVRGKGGWGLGLSLSGLPAVMHIQEGKMSSDRQIWNPAPTHLFGGVVEELTIG